MARWSLLHVRVRDPIRVQLQIIRVSVVLCSALRIIVTSLYSVELHACTLLLLESRTISLRSSRKSYMETPYCRDSRCEQRSSSTPSGRSMSRIDTGIRILYIRVDCTIMDYELPSVLALLYWLDIIFEFPRSTFIGAYRYIVGYSLTMR